MKSAHRACLILVMSIILLPFDELFADYSGTITTE